MHQSEANAGASVRPRRRAAQAAAGAVAKQLVLVLALSCAAAGPVVAQQSANDVSDAQVAEYKAAAEAGCKEGGRNQGDPQDKVDAFCGCVVRTLSKSMTYSEWQQAFFLSKTKQNQQEMELLAPHMKKLDSCRAEPR